ncbi:MAG: 1-(5-phosphoribosyl)-5-((5-phosphoribosylamino)methylideneamino)imidazole-4-carboxamide isomerase [Actinobacteria bacterium]|nr:1-(5-phosphoribosyl)-5-((5-phosphoribosylamino)methylideneamino)imidazole-4-carboxamide isomerase [Actinomycetota bacterium]
MEFIFMLTQDDRTIPDALEVYDSIRRTELRYVGFKDVGVDRPTLQKLTAEMHADDRQVMLEVVSTSRDDELRSIQAAVDVGVDYILGGTNTEAAGELLAGSGVRYYPFPGTIVGHPSELRGDIEEIAEHARHLTRTDGIDGVDLLAYRHRGVDPVALTKAVVDASHGPVIAAGSVDSEERIQALQAAGAWGFTIGNAILAGQMPEGPDVAAQITWTLRAAAGA